MGRRRPRRAPAHPPRVVLQSTRTPDVWAEQTAAGIVVHYAHRVTLTAPTRPDAGTRRMAERIFGSGADRLADDADLGPLVAAAFGDQPLDDLPPDRRMVALGAVLKLWGVKVPWR